MERFFFRNDILKIGYFCDLAVKISNIGIAFLFCIPAQDFAHQIDGVLEIIDGEIHKCNSSNAFAAEILGLFGVGTEYDIRVDRQKSLGAHLIGVQRDILCCGIHQFEPLGFKCGIANAH